MHWLENLLDHTAQSPKSQNSIKPKICPQHNLTSWYNSDFTEADLMRAINATRPSAPGPDTIPPSFFTHLPRLQQTRLLAFYNYIWATGVPHQWHLAHILPFLKPNKPPTNPSSYRPIALTNSLCKLFEKMVCHRLRCYLERASHIDPNQSVFRTRHSTLDPLTRLESDIRYGLILDNPTIAVFLDFTRAFDSVWHSGLLQKLENLGVKGRMLTFIRGFLQHRRIQVRVQNTLSTQHSVTSGVPQGSVLSPLLFLIMINDIFNTSDIKYSLFADDCAIWSTKSSITLCTNALQMALNNITAWTNTWNMKMSAPKSKAMLFCNNRSPQIPTLLLANQPLEFVNTHRFLGIILDRRLTYRQHILELKERCQRALRLLTVVSAHKWGADFSTLRHLYISLIRSKLDYGSFLFISTAATTLTILDRIQYAASRIILGALRCTQVKSLEAEADLQPLSLRRRYLLTTYATRVLPIQAHPVRKMLLDYYPYNFYQIQRRPLPTIGLIYNEFRVQNLALTSIPCLKPEMLFPITTAKIDFSLHSSKKQDLPPTAWQACFADLHLKYPSYSPVYCDGSKTTNQTAAGVWSQTFSLMARLNRENSIFTAELTAIYYALMYLKDKEGSYLLASDSLSSLRALQNAHTKSHFLVLKIIHLLSTIPNKVILVWVPSHSNIEGNEKADQIAREALNLPLKVTPSFSDQEIKHILTSHYHSLWKLQWEESSAKLRPYKNSLGQAPYLLIKRSHQVPISRLRLGATRLTHAHLFTGQQPACCPTCNQTWTATHLLLECPQLQHSRQQLEQHCRKMGWPFTLATLLGDEFPAEKLVTYLSKAGFIDQL